MLVVQPGIVLFGVGANFGAHNSDNRETACSADEKISDFHDKSKNLTRNNLALLEMICCCTASSAASSHVVRMQLDLDQRVGKELKPDETEVLHREQRRVVIRIGDRPAPPGNSALSSSTHRPSDVTNMVRRFTKALARLNLKCFYTRVGDGSR